MMTDFSFLKGTVHLNLGFREIIKNYEVSAKKQEKLFAKGLRKIYLIQRRNNFIFVTVLANTCSCFKYEPH